MGTGLGGRVLAVSLWGCYFYTFLGSRRPRRSRALTWV